MRPRAITQGLRRLLNPRAADRDLDDEIAQYLSAAADEYVGAGMTRAEAERKARLDFGGVESAKDAVREAGWESVPDRLRRDVAFSLRTFARNPGFAAAVLITLALGIGATTAMFTVLNAVLLRPLPYHDPGKLALIWTDDVRRGLHQEPTALLTIQDWRRDARSFESIAYYSVQRGAMTVNGQRATARTSYVSGNTFGVLGVKAALGRTLTPADEERAEPVAVISHALWQREFHGDSLIVGRTLLLEGATKTGGGTRTIVGVMPASFYFPYRQTDIWMPSTLYWRFGLESVERFSSSARRWTVVARLRDEQSIDEARAELVRVGSRLSATQTTTIPEFPGFATTVMPILDSVAARNLRTAMWVLMGGVVLVLLVACANVANLLLARGAARQHELRIRQALGASRPRLVGQLLVESLLLALIGGAVGVALAWSAVRVIAGVGAAQVPRLACSRSRLRQRYSPEWCSGSRRQSASPAASTRE
jgi:predicted permease